MKVGHRTDAVPACLGFSGVAAVCRLPRRGFQRRVLVSTDLTARGVDLARVNLVVNLDLPPEAATLLHRIGRTGRWGSRGVAVTFCLGDELPKLRDLIDEVLPVTAPSPSPFPLPYLLHLIGLAGHKKVDNSAPLGRRFR